MADSGEARGCAQNAAARDGSKFAPGSDCVRHSPRSGRDGDVGQRGGVDHSDALGPEYSEFDFDLFGVPIPAVRGRGRPPYVPDEATRRRVVEMRRGGATAAAIAAAIGIGRTTLYQFYGAEVRKENDDG